MARRFTRSRGRSGSHRQTVWIAVTETGTVLAAANSVARTNLLNAAALALRPFTIVRTRGVISIGSDQVAASEDYEAAMGMAVISDQASAIGVTAVPTPFTDLGSDLFFVHEMQVGGLEVVTAAGFDAQTVTSRTYDSKAMRKVNEDEQVNVMLEASSISNGCTVFHAARMLIKTH